MNGWDGYPVIGAARDHDDGEWLRLPDNGWGALVAYLAGPHRVRAVAIEHRDVRVVMTQGGVTTGWTERPTQDDIDHGYSDVVDYLARAGIGPPPTGVSWEVRLPRGTGKREFEGAINVAMMEVPTSDSFVREREALEAALAALYSGS